MGLGLSIALASAPGIAAEALLKTVRIATGLQDPLWVGAAPGDSSRLFILEQVRARIRILELATGQLRPAPFLDLDPLVSDDGGERGLLGLAFHPDYAANGALFVHYSDNQGDTVIARYRASADPNLADPASAEILLHVDQPFGNHNGGQLAFGPDGRLYIGLGDGGSAFDPGNRAQDGASLLGKLLRIAVEPSGPYTIPADNPFAGGGPPLDEIWALGLRNPWRFSFDRLTGDLYIGDVGQNQFEEVDFQPAASAGGENYGWRCMEGNHSTGLSGCGTAALVPPIWEYGHDDGCSVTGGLVYRGCAIPELQGTYFFADFCSARIWSLRHQSGLVRDFTDWTAELDPPGAARIDAISSFGEDGSDELYIVDYADGELYKIVPRSAAPTLALATPAEIGTTIELRLARPASAGAGYACGFALGSEPGILLGDGRRVPLNADDLLAYSLQPNPHFIDTQDQLDGAGNALVRIAVPAEPSLRGLTIYGACAILDPTAFLGIGKLTCPLAITFE